VVADGICRPTSLAGAQTSKGFPLVVICTTGREAEEVYQCQPAIERLNIALDIHQILASFLQSNEVAAVLRNTTRFYGVLAGMAPGIYLS
jgi:hypothetical protein